jgi:CheY-like chemotaxis protein
MSAVLVVEDDFDIRESLVDLLEDDGMEAVSAKDGRDGLLALRMNPDVRLILLDLSMPMMDGRAFRAEQLADPALASIPVVVLSAEPDIASAAAELGAAFALPKPFRPEMLLGALHHLP